MLLRRSARRWAVAALGAALAVWAVARAAGPATPAAPAGNPTTAPAAAARPAFVRAQTGELYWGDVDDSNPAEVVVSARGYMTDKGIDPLGGAKVRITRQNIGTITPFATPKDEYDAVMARLKPNDLTGRVLVARWAMDKQQPELARAALEQAKAIDANNLEVNAMLDRVNKQIAATQPPVPTQPAAGAGDHGTGGAATGAGGSGNPPAVAATAPPVLPVRQVTPDEINAIKQTEWRAGDRSVQTKVPPDVRKAFIDSGVLPPKEAATLQPNDLAMEILQRGTPAMKEQVVIVNDPAPLKEFKMKVEKTLQTGCVQCHTVGKVGKGNNFALYAGNADADVYSNFLIVQQYTGTVPDPKQPGKTVVYSMIERLSPPSSLLVQYALPPLTATVPHPTLKPPAAPYAGALRGPNAPQYQELVHWISSLSPIAPDYGIDLTKPAAKPAAGGTTRPAAPRPPVAPAAAPPHTPAPAGAATGAGAGAGGGAGRAPPAP